MIKKILIALLAFILVLTILEISARVFHFSEIFTKENCSKYSDHINLLNFRDIEHSKIKQPDTFRIVLLGDSFSFARGVPFEDIFPRRLEHKLNESSRSLKFEVINCSKPGWNSVQEVSHFEKKCRIYKPDMVLIAYVLNDTECTNKAGPVNMEYVKRLSFHEPKSKFLQFLFVHSALFNYTYCLIENTRISKEWVASREDFYRENSSCYIEFKESIQKLKKIMKEDNFRTVVVIFPYFQFRLQKYPFHDLHKKATALFQQSGFHVLDLYNTYKDYDNEELKLCPSNAHPNIKAHHLAADAISAYLQSIMIQE